MTPIIINMTPPHSSARSFRANPQPHFMPKIKPAIDRANDTKPIIQMGERMAEKFRIPKKAKDIPMAKASILVAMAIVNTTFKLAGLKS